MKIGYARVSTDDQHLDLQLNALSQANCHVIFRDQGISGANFCRPGLTAALELAGSGDQLVVWRLDRLGRSLSKLVELLGTLGERNIQFSSLTESIDTLSAGGRLVFHMMAALSEFERSLISERTRAGLEAARARGVQLGRRPALSPTQSIEALDLLSTTDAKEVAQIFDVHPRTLRRLVDRAKNDEREGSPIPAPTLSPDEQDPLVVPD